MLEHNVLFNVGLLKFNELRLMLILVKCGQCRNYNVNLRCGCIFVNHLLTGMAENSEACGSENL